MQSKFQILIALLEKKMGMHNMFFKIYWIKSITINISKNHVDITKQYFSNYEVIAIKYTSIEYSSTGTPLLLFSSALPHNKSYIFVSQIWVLQFLLSCGFISFRFLSQIFFLLKKSTSIHTLADNVWLITCWTTFRTVNILNLHK